MISNLKMWDYIYPPRCPLCDRIYTDGICKSCRDKLFPIGDEFCAKCGKPIDGAEQELCFDCKKNGHIFVCNRSVYSYSGEIRASLYKLKYGNKRDYGRIFGREMAKALEKWIGFSGITMIVPVPLHTSRERYRGYNQAEIIADELGKCLGIPVNNNILFRIRKTLPQKLTDKHGRRKNLYGAFAALDIDLSSEVILLVDDIYTTGNTLDMAAMEMVRAGAMRVYGATVAIGG